MRQMITDNRTQATLTWQLYNALEHLYGLNPVDSLLRPTYLLGWRVEAEMQ